MTELISDLLPSFGEVELVSDKGKHFEIFMKNIDKVLKDNLSDHVVHSMLAYQSRLYEKNWLQLNCTDIIETFIKFELKNNSDSLKRHKLLTKAIKKLLLHLTLILWSALKPKKLFLDYF